jgi:phosphotransferase system  glucose/maltose/N-acetylglucosamine-specific IIC component
VLTVLAASGTTHTSLLAEPGTVAFLVVFGMAVILYFVFRSMAKHLRKVNQMARDEEEAAARAEEQDATSDASDMSR